jgi:DNA polymerase-3 subunit epsilon
MLRYDEDLLDKSVTFVVIDFETTTPRGYPAQPVEVAALALRAEGNSWQEVGSFASLIKPPPFAPITPADTLQTGLTPAMFEKAGTAAEVLSALDRRFDSANNYLLVAQHAATEANIIFNSRSLCPRLARLDYLDTISLAKRAAPGLPNYRLDTLLAHYSIDKPPDRHRAAADVGATAELFMELWTALALVPSIAVARDILRWAGRVAKLNTLTQEPLFLESGVVIGETDG